jgi:superfamily II DNA or RNA helicase
MYPRKVNVWWKVGDVLCAPRFWLRDKGVDVDMHVNEGTPVTYDSRVTLRDDLDQVTAMRATMESIRTYGGAVLSLGTGQGKTVCACHAIAELGVKTMVLVHKDVLRQQWTERINQFLPGAHVSYVQGQTQDMSGDIVIGMLQTLTSPRRTFDFSEVGLVIVDECHHIAAESFSTAMRLFACRWHLGLSATPKRKDMLTRVIHWFLGPLSYAAQRREMSHVQVDCQWYSCDRYTTDPLPLNRSGNVDHPKMMTQLTEDSERTQFIADLIEKIRKKEPDRAILVLSHRRQLCEELARLIPGAVTFLGGPKSKKKTEDAKAHLTAPVVCATFSLASEGYDDPRLNTLVLATPCSDVTQPAGRILRGTSVGHVPLIVDICDTFSVGYAQAAKRKSYYRRSGFKFVR